jgi:hypothetical protein
MKQKSFFTAAGACFLTGLISAESALRIGQNYLNIGRIIPGTMQIGIVLLYILGLVAYIFTGLRKANMQEGADASSLAFWQGTLRCVIAFDLCVFGIGKFFNIQFHTPLTWLDSPYFSLAPQQLFWAFFGHFYAFPRIIGAMQIAGSLMLLFRKTRLFGVVFLMPILLNILLLDSFIWLAQYIILL